MSRVWTTANVNLRSSPAIDPRNPRSNIVTMVSAGVELVRIDEVKNVWDKQYEFVPVLYTNPTAQSSVLAYRLGWVSSLYLRTTPPVEEPPPPTPAKSTIFGLHYYFLSSPSYPEYEWFWKMVREGLVSTVVVVNEVGVANTLAEMGVKNVVLRLGVTENPTEAPNLLPPLTGTLNDLKLGQEWWEANWRIGGRDADSRVILQIGNEWQIRENLPEADAFFWRGVIAEADKAGRRVAIFNDAVGTPDIKQTPSGNRSIIWEARKSAIFACMVDGNGQNRPLDRQHFVSYHAYSRKGPYKASDPIEWDWWAGRLHRVFGRPDSIYPTVRPRILYTEYGSFDASVPKMPGGIKDVVDDIEMSLRNSDPLCDGFAYWTLGDWNQSNIREGLPQIYEVVKRASQNK